MKGQPHGAGGRKGPKSVMANHWKRWDAKPEAKERLSALCPFGCNLANRRKLRGAKPEAKWRLSALCPFGCKLANRGKPRGAKPEATGRAGPLVPKTRGERNALCPFGYRTLFASENFAKKGSIA